MISPKDKCYVTFNRFLTDFVRDINKASDVLKKRNKTNKLNVIESCSSKYIEAFIENARKSGAFAAVASAAAGGSPQGSLLKDDALRSLVILPETTVAEIFELLKKKSESTHATKEYVLLFLIVGSLASTSNEDVIDDVISLVAMIQGDEDAADGGDDAVTSAIQGAAKLTADVKNLLLELHWTVCVGDDDGDCKEEMGGEGASANKNSPFNIDPRMLENTTIGDIAKEVAQELDVSNMDGIRSMEDVFKNTGNGNVIGNIVSKVGSKLQEKIANGNINQQDLIKEAFGMFSPFMSDMLKNMPNNPTKRSLSTRERLKKRLSERTAAGTAPVS